MQNNVSLLKLERSVLVIRVLFKTKYLLLQKMYTSLYLKKTVFFTISYIITNVSSDE